MTVNNQESIDLEPNSLVSQVISTWRSGSLPDAKEVLRQHPHLRQHHSLVIDLAYEEYCLRREAGERVVMSTFCDRFPTVHKSLRVLLATHECIEEDGELGNGPSKVRWPDMETLFLGFYLLREIGRGAFARVYLATEPALGDRLVVLKISRRGTSEAETLGRLAHRNIVPVYSVQEDPETGLSVICMPYLGSGTLLQAIDAIHELAEKPDGSLFAKVGSDNAIIEAISGEFRVSDQPLHPFSYDDAVTHLTAQLADALEYAHRMGVCHRDLKPSNVLLAPSGRPLLLDFNLSSDQRHQHTLIGGTLPYMPPEQLQTVVDEKSTELHLGDPRSDIFSLGVMLFEMLTGNLPFGDQNPLEPANVAAVRILDQQRQPLKDILSRHPELDSQLAHIIEQCVRIDPEQRIQTAEELARRLRSRLTRRARWTRWAHRRRFLLTTAAAGFGLASAATGFGLATRPSYAERCYTAGILACQDQNWTRAVELFSEAQQLHPEAFEPLLARGQARIQSHQFNDALADLKKVYQLAPTGPRAAWAAYAAELAQETIAADYFQRQAVETHHYTTAAVWNNYGYLFRFTSDMQPTAIAYLSRALEVDPKCQAAYLNRCLIYANLHARRPDAPGDEGISCHELALADAQAATRLKPYPAFAYFALAMVHLMDDQSPNRQEAVLENMRRALDLGFDRDKLLHECGFPDEFTAPLEDYPVPAKQLSFYTLLMAPPNEFPAWQPE